MANVNINRNVDDAFYRYKMPKLIAKVEGKGNGIKTVIVNMTEIAKALCRPPTYPTKFFGCELGAQTQFDVKNERFIVNGSHDASKLQDLLDGFIKRFVLCPECDNPETNLNIKKGGISQRCIACGYQGQIDMRHKLTTYILKNPPDQDPTAIGTTPNKKDKKAKKKGSKSDAGEDGEDEEKAPSPIMDAKPVSKKKSRREEDDDWGEDTSEAAVAARMGELSSAAKNMTLSEDVEKTPQERVDLFYKFVEERKATSQVIGVEKEKEILAEADRLDIKDKAPLVLAELLYDANIISQIKQYRSLFLRFTHGNTKAQKYLLGGFEQLVGNVHPDALLAKVPKILQQFYEMDIMEEEVIIDWDKKASKKYVSKEMSKEIHNKATPFIKWLEEAEEETSEDDEEEVEVVYSHTEKAGAQTVAKPSSEPEDDEEDDFDIDAI